MVEFDDEVKRASHRGKAEAAAIDWAVTGLYFYDAGRRDRRGPEALRPRRTGNHRCQPGLPRAANWKSIPLGRGVAWLDTGTYDSLLASSLFVQTLEERQGLKSRAWRRSPSTKLHRRQTTRQAGRRPRGQRLRAISAPNRRRKSPWQISGQSGHAAVRSYLQVDGSCRFAAIVFARASPQIQLTCRVVPR